MPFAIKPRVEEEIAKLIRQGILEPVAYTDWATPLVVVCKKDDSIRLCGDYRSTVNQALKKNTSPLPTITEMLTLVAPGKVFSKLDLSQAYQQLKGDDETAAVLTVNTHKELFRVNCLLFGIAAAPGEFKREMDTLLQGIDSVGAYLDDVVISGRDESEHNIRLQEVLRRLEKVALTCRKSKCRISVREIEFLGYKITGDGVSPINERYKAI